MTEYDEIIKAINEVMETMMKNDRALLAVIEASTQTITSTQTSYSMMMKIIGVLSTQIEELEKKVNMLMEIHRLSEIDKAEDNLDNLLNIHPSK